MSKDIKNTSAEEKIIETSHENLNIDDIEVKLEVKSEDTEKKPKDDSPSGCCGSCS